MEADLRISTFSALGERLSQFLSEDDRIEPEIRDSLNQAINLAFSKNGWFTRENCQLALRGIAEFLQEEALRQWIKPYAFVSEKPKTVGLIMAGNIPLVGFHDLLCVLISGNKAVVKMSSDDQVLLPEIANLLFEIAPEWRDYLRFTDQLKGVDAVIATGSNNSARYFEYYFRNIPHVIRKNRSSVALLTGDETEEELKLLGKDVFQYFGLGCRNVSQIILPKDFDLNRIFGAFIGFSDVVHHHKYGNNYQYYRAVYALNRLELLENGFMLMREDRQIHSPLSMLHYWRYDSMKEVEVFLKENHDQIQCVVGRTGVSPVTVAFGNTQQPGLADYADGVDTLRFLAELS